MNILLTIAARGGSKGVKNKNIRPLLGKPLIAHTILQAIKWGEASHVVVTTDSTEIAEVARQYGAEVPFMRPAEFATDTSSKLPALRHALLEMERIHHISYDFVVDLDPTCPIRKTLDIEAAVKLFIERRPKTLFSVVPSHKNPYFNMVELNSNGWAHLSKPLNEKIFRRQDAPEVYSMNASIYVYDKNFLLKGDAVAVVTDKSCIYLMDDVSGFDIDREIDFVFVEFLVERGLVSLETYQ